LGCNGGKVVVACIESPPIDGQILPLDEAILLQLAEHLLEGDCRQRRQHAEAPRSVRLLRPCRHRPCGRRAAEQPDEGASFHSVSPARSSKPCAKGGAAPYRQAGRATRSQRKTPPHGRGSTDNDVLSMG